MKNEVVKVICEAWRSKQPELLNDIIADNFTWRETPFANVKTDKQKLLKMWKEDLAGQSNITVECLDITEQDSIVVSNWKASFDRGGKHMDMDGIFVVTMNSEGKLTEFRQWWVTK